ncbi:hypothetical protein BGZ94_007967 [Podila epigama]|nr:hypothetical protein BGZ94_007967 [Podila epigama]
MESSSPPGEISSLPPETTDPPVITTTTSEPTTTTTMDPTTTTTPDIPTTDPITTTTVVATTTTIDTTPSSDTTIFPITTTTFEPSITTPKETTTTTAGTTSTKKSTTATTPYTTRYVTTVTFVTITSLVPETTRISGTVKTVYVNRTVVTRQPTIIPDPNQPPPPLPPPPITDIHTNPSALQTWQITLIVVAILVICLVIGSIALISWLQKRRRRKRDIPFSKLDLRSAGILEPWEKDVIDGNDASANQYSTMGSRVAAAWRKKKNTAAAAGVGARTAGLNPSSPGGGGGIGGNDIDDGEDGLPTSGRANSLPRVVASGMGGYEHGSYLDMYGSNQDPLAQAQLQQDMPQYEDFEHYRDWPDRRRSEAWSGSSGGGQQSSHYYVNSNDDENSGLVHPQYLDQLTPTSVAQPRYVISAPAPASRTSPVSISRPSSSALSPLLEGRASESTDRTDILVPVSSTPGLSQQTATGSNRISSSSAGDHSLIHKDSQDDDAIVKTKTRRESNVPESSPLDTTTSSTVEVRTRDSVVTASENDVGQSSQAGPSSSSSSSSPLVTPIPPKPPIPPPTSSSPSTTTTTTVRIVPAQLEKNAKYEHFRQGPQALLEESDSPNPQDVVLPTDGDCIK